MTTRQTLSTAAAIDAFLETVAKRHTLSLSGAVTAIRGAVPACELTDPELGNLVAFHAMRHGVQGVIFDVEVERRSIERALP